MSSRNEHKRCPPSSVCFSRWFPLDKSVQWIVVMIRMKQFAINCAGKQADQFVEIIHDTEKLCQQVFGTIRDTDTVSIVPGHPFSYFPQHLWKTATVYQPQVRIRYRFEWTRHSGMRIKCTAHHSIPVILNVVCSSSYYQTRTLGAATTTAVKLLWPHAVYPCRAIVLLFGCRHLLFSVLSSIRW